MHFRDSFNSGFAAAFMMYWDKSFLVCYVGTSHGDKPYV